MLDAMSDVFKWYFECTALLSMNHDVTFFLSE